MDIVAQGMGEIAVVCMADSAVVSTAADAMVGESEAQTVEGLPLHEQPSPIAFQRYPSSSDTHWRDILPHTEWHTPPDQFASVLASVP